jgi:predicted membrane-bound mannosyltransferase
VRLPTLDVRPIHADEAFHAAKIASLLEQGLDEHHPGAGEHLRLSYRKGSAVKL